MSIRAAPRAGSSSTRTLTLPLSLPWLPLIAVLFFVLVSGRFIFAIAMSTASTEPRLNRPRSSSEFLQTTDSQGHSLHHHRGFVQPAPRQE